MKIISFLNSKGGVGKTTLAINVSRYLYIYMSRFIQREFLDGKPSGELPKILLIDADPQGSVRDWQEAGEQTDIQIIAADRRQTLLSATAFIDKGNYDFIVIDTPGKTSDLMATAISISDVCLIPVQPSPYDLWASNDIVELIQTRQMITNGKPEAFYVLNRCIPNTKIGKEVSEYLKTCPLETLGETVCQRVVYAESARYGCTVFDSSNEQAKIEISKLGESLISVLFGENKNGV